MVPGWLEGRYGSVRGRGIGGRIVVSVSSQAADGEAKGRKTMVRKTFQDWAKVRIRIMVIVVGPAQLSSSSGVESSKR